MSYDPRQISFLVELLLGVLLFTSRFKRRKAIRWLSVPAAILLYGLPFAAMPHDAENITGVLQAIGYYGISVVVVIGLVYCCFCASWLDAFIISVSAYIAQHCAYNILMSAIIITGYDMGRIYFTETYFLFEVVIYGIVYSLTYVVFGRNFEIDRQKAKSGVVWIAACVMILLLVIVFNIVFITRQSEDVRVICYIYDTVCTVSGMVLLMLVSKNDQLMNDMRQMEQLWEMKREFFELSKENIDLINIKCHDIRRHIADLSSQKTNPIDQETLREIERSIEIYDSTFQTGNDLLDVILTEKSLFCGKHGINLTCIADGRKLSFLGKTDLLCLLGNIIDNSIESVQGLEDASKRIISLTIKANGQFLSIQEENYYAGELEFFDGLPLTTKQDKQNHGFGLKSISYLTKKYGGELSIKTKQGIFFLNILIPIPYKDLTLL